MKSDSANHDVVFLSDLRKKSRRRLHVDFVAATDYIFGRLEELNHSNERSQFNNMYKIIKIIPRSLFLRLLHHLRYDVVIGFRQDDQQRHIYVMIAYQKHPPSGKVGMFDFYIPPQYRAENILANFSIVANLIYRAGLRFRKQGYRYIQCGDNDVTRRILLLYKRLIKKNNWSPRVEVSESRIYL